MFSLGRPLAAGTQACGPGAVPWIAEHFHDCVYNWRDYAGFVLGLMAIVFWVFAQLPQFVSNFRNKSAEALSPWFLAQWLLGDTFNLTGALMQGEQLPTTTYTAMYFVLSDVFMMMQFIYYGALQRRREKIALLQARYAARAARHHHHHHHHHHRDGGGGGGGGGTEGGAGAGGGGSGGVGGPGGGGGSGSGGGGGGLDGAALDPAYGTGGSARSGSWRRPGGAKAPGAQWAAADGADGGEGPGGHGGGSGLGSFGGGPAAQQQTPCRHASGRGRHPAGRPLAAVAVLAALGLAAFAGLGPGGSGGGRAAPAAPQRRLQAAGGPRLAAWLGEAPLPRWEAQQPLDLSTQQQKQQQQQQQRQALGGSSSGGGGIVSSSSSGGGGGDGLGGTSSSSGDPRLGHLGGDSGGGDSGGGDSGDDDDGGGRPAWMVTLGTSLGWVSSLLYLASRVSQIHKNYTRRSAEGLALAMFVLAATANLCTGTGILLRTFTWRELVEQGPWLAGSLGTITLDMVILSQSLKYGDKPPLPTHQSAAAAAAQRHQQQQRRRHHAAHPHDGEQEQRLHHRPGAAALLPAEGADDGDEATPLLLPT